MKKRNKNPRARVNPVAKVAHRFNKSAVHMDRKKEQKKRGVPNEN